MLPRTPWLTLDYPVVLRIARGAPSAGGGQAPLILRIALAIALLSTLAGSLHPQDIVSIAAPGIGTAAPSGPGPISISGPSSYLTVNVTPSVPDLPLTLPLGSALTSGQVLTVWNTPGANPYAFTMLGTLVPPNSGLLVQWTGTRWIPLNTFRNPGVYVVDGVTILNIGAAYSLCTGAGTLTPAGCQIWDYNLQAGEVMNSLPWSNTGSEVPIELHLGPGKLKICDTTSCAQSFSFTVPRLSRVIGSGRQNTGSTVGTAIVAGSNFGPGNLSSAPGGELTVIAGQPSFSTPGCGSSPTVTISPPGAPGGTTATVTPIVSGGSILSLEVTNPGSGYNANPTASISPCTGSTLAFLYQRYRPGFHVYGYCRNKPIRAPDNYSDLRRQRVVINANLRLYAERDNRH